MDIDLHAHFACLTTYPFPQASSLHSSHFDLVSSARCTIPHSLCQKYCPCQKHPFPFLSLPAVFLFKIHSSAQLSFVYRSFCQSLPAIPSSTLRSSYVHQIITSLRIGTFTTGSPKPKAVFSSSGKISLNE